MSDKKQTPLAQEFFIVGFMVGLKTYIIPQPFGAPNAASAAAALTAIVTANLPKITGFELYRYNTEYENNRELIMAVPVMQMMTWAAPQIEAITGQQTMKAAVQAKGASVNGENLKALYEEAKKQGAQIL
jgi:hypothetical protein